MRKTAIMGLWWALAACSEDVGGAGNEGSSGGAAPDAGSRLVVPVPGGARTHVSLSVPEIVEVAEPRASMAWDLAFEGYDVYTNSGASGPGDGGAFGPLDPPVFLGDERPEVPFIAEDETGGAFLDWYAYEGTTHALFSRYHVYGVRARERVFKVQILGYYGEVAGAPVTAIYSLRWAEVTASGSGATTTLTDVDGTAGGLQPEPDAPSECLDLASGARLMLTPEQAQGSADWHLCFRRSAISVNGELGGPGDVGAVDTDAEATATETLEEVQERTAESELARFDGADHAALDAPALVYRGDRIVSAFGDAWYERDPRAPAPATWLSIGADGQRAYLLAFERFEQPTDAAPSQIILRFKAVP
jgi:hypothetical protein